MSNNDGARVFQKFVALAFCRADLLFEVDQSARIQFCAGATEQVLGLENHDLDGQPFADIFDARDRDFVSDLITGASAEARLEEIEVRVERANGSAGDAVLSGYRAPEFGDNLFLAIKMLSKRRAQAIQRPVAKDEATGLLDTQGFADAATEGIRAIADAGGDAKLTLLNLAGLEAGRDAADPEKYSGLMENIGEILKGHAVGGQAAGRIAEENFGLVHAGDIDAQQLKSQIGNAAAESGVMIEPNVQSAEIDDLALDEDQLGKAIEYTIRGFNRDRSLPQGKKLQDIFGQLMEETMQQVDRFRRICQTRDFDLHFMPICSLATGKIDHLETLTRFRGSGTDTSSPYQLITLAEEVGVIADFDLAVARKTIDLVKAHANQRDIPPLAFNVSGHSIQNADFVGELTELLRQVTNLSKEISLEITESAEITDFENVNTAIQEIRSRGFKVALDDFGAGAAGFDYLNNFDVDCIKFDGPVVRRAIQTVKGKAFLTSMATLCTTTGIETIAEMVEDEETAEFLKTCGVDLGQGYHFGKPDPDPKAFNE